MSSKQSTKKNILITGGAGFIGTHLIERLVTNHTITVFDNYRRDALHFTSLKKEKNLTLVKGDVLDSNSLKKVCVGQEVIYHLAAVAGVSSYEKNPLQTLEVDALGTYNLLRCASQCNVKQVVLFSSSEVYGPFADNVSEDSQTIQGPATQSRWSYAVGKLVGDHFGFAFSKMKGISVTILRPFNIYGPRQIGEGAIQTFMSKAILNKPLSVRGDGSQIRSWCYIDDFMRAATAVIGNQKAYNQIFNVGNSQSVISSLELAKLVISITNSPSQILFSKEENAPISHRVPNTQKAENVLQYKPMVHLKEGLQQTYAWYKEHQTV